MKLYHFHLTGEEREELVRFTTTGRHAAPKVMHAKILIKAQKGLSVEEIAKHLDVSVRTVERARKRCTLEGITAGLTTKKRPPRNLIQVAAAIVPEAPSRAAPFGMG